MAIPKILGNSAIYTGVTVLQRCVYFLLLPLYTAYLTPEDYGITGIVASVSSLLAIFTTLGVSSAGSRFYYKYKGEPQYVKRLYGTIVCSILINSAIFGCLFIFAHKWIVDPIVGEIDFFPYVFLGLLNVLVAPLYILFQSYLQTIQDGVKFGVNAMLNFFLLVGLTILFIVVFKMKAEGVLLANLLTSIVFFIYVIFAFVRHQQIGIEKQILKEAYRYSLPLLPHTLANWSNGTIDKLLVNSLRSTSDAGLYNIGRQYSTVANTISTAINSAYVPWFFDKANDISKNLPSIRKMSEMIVFSMSLIAIIMSLFAKEVLDIMISNPAYEGVWKVIPFLIAGVIFDSIYFFYVNVLFLKNTGVIFTITVTSIIINIIMNILLIPILGYIGCGLACMATYFVKSIMAVIISILKNKEIRFRTYRLYTIGFIASLICISSLAQGGLTTLQAVAAKLIIIVLFGATMFLVHKQELEVIYQPMMIKIFKK